MIDYSGCGSQIPNFIIVNSLYLSYYVCLLFAIILYPIEKLYSTLSPLPGSKTSVKFFDDRIIMCLLNSGRIALMVFFFSNARQINEESIEYLTTSQLLSIMQISIWAHCMSDLLAYISMVMFTSQLLKSIVGRKNSADPVGNKFLIALNIYHGLILSYTIIGCALVSTYGLENGFEVYLIYRRILFYAVGFVNIFIEPFILFYTRSLTAAILHRTKREEDDSISKLKRKLKRMNSGFLNLGIALIINGITKCLFQILWEIYLDQPINQFIVKAVLYAFISISDFPSAITYFLAAIHKIKKRIQPTTSGDNSIEISNTSTPNVIASPGVLAKTVIIKEPTKVNSDLSGAKESHTKSRENIRSLGATSGKTERSVENIRSSKS